MRDWKRKTMEPEEEPEQPPKPAKKLTVEKPKVEYRDRLITESDKLMMLYEIYQKVTELHEELFNELKERQD